MSRVRPLFDSDTVRRLATSRYCLHVALGLVLCFRLIYVLSIPNAISNWRDGLSYDNIARNLISGVGYWDTTGQWPGEPVFADPSSPTARWMPGYPMFVAAVYLVFGANYRAVYVVQAILGLAIAGLIYLTGVRTLGRQAGLLAIGLYAVEPFSIYLCGRFQTEELFTLLICTTLYAFLRMTEVMKGRLYFALLFGLTAGGAALTRNVAALMFGGLCLAVLLGHGEGLDRMRFGPRFSMLAIASMTFLGVLTPWLIRNYQLTGQYKLSTQSWQAMAMTNNDHGGVYFTRESEAAMPQTSIEQPEIEREAVYRAFVTDWISRHPWRFATLFLRRAIVFWSPIVSVVTGKEALLGVVFNVVVFTFAGLSLFANRMYWRKILPIPITLLTFTLGYSLVAVITRYRLPLYPLLEILAAGGVLSVWSSGVGTSILAFLRRKSLSQWKRTAAQNILE